jgi:hypothetical protein
MKRKAQLLVQDRTQEGTVDVEFAIVLDKAQFPDHKLFWNTLQPYQLQVALSAKS